MTFGEEKEIFVIGEEKFNLLGVTKEQILPHNQRISYPRWRLAYQATRYTSLDLGREQQLRLSPARKLCAWSWD